MNIEKLLRWYNAPYNYFKHKSIQKYNLSRVNGFTNGNQPLSKGQKKAALDFFAPYCKISPAYHTFYFEKTGHFSEKYLPTDVYANHVDAYFNDRVGAKKIDNKCLYPVLFSGIPQADCLAFRKNGFWLDQSNTLLSAEDLRILVDAEPALFVKKATNSFGGKGVHYFEPDHRSLYEQLVKVTDRDKDDIVVQRPLKQHAALAAINESSVNTIRVLSLLSEDGVKIYSSVLRMGIGSAKVDNASSGGVTCGITPEGKLKKTAYKPSGEKYDTHPTSGVVFDGYAIPGIHEVWDLVKVAHPMVPHFRLVSWDFAINEEGHPVMIEANLCLGELDFHQLNNGPVFGEDTKKILDEVFGKK